MSKDSAQSSDGFGTSRHNESRIARFLPIVAVSALPYIPELGRKPDSDAYYDLKHHPDGQTYPGLSILRFDGGLFFANGDALNDRLHDRLVHSGSHLNGVILSMEGVDYIDAKGADALNKIALSGKDTGIDLYLAHVKPQVMEVLRLDGVVTCSAPRASKMTLLLQLHYERKGADLRRSIVRTPAWCCAERDSAVRSSH